MKPLHVLFLVFLVSGAASLVLADQSQILFPAAPAPSTTGLHQLSQAITGGDWTEHGRQFTDMQAHLFRHLFLLVLTILPAVFLVHFLVIGAKRFSHTGERVLFFPAFVRFIHWMAALSFTLLALTGLMVIFGKYVGGGGLVMTGRTVHFISALVFTATAAFMLLIWLKDMLPMPYDLLWLLILGGYLSRKKQPIPAGKFNFGQKTWFWLATLGGGVMAYSGWQLYTFQENADQLRQMAILHNLLGAVLVAFFLIHLYMSLFAIKGALSSMLTGYKPREEVEILHARFTPPKP